MLILRTEFNPLICHVSCMHVDLVHNELKLIIYIVCGTGKDNIVSSLDNVAKELAFNYPSEMVNGVFERKESLFFPFELPSEERGRRAVA